LGVRFGKKKLEGCGPRLEKRMKIRKCGLKDSRELSWKNRGDNKKRRETVSRPMEFSRGGEPENGK